MDSQPLVLIIDDEADLREMFSLKLTASGYKVDTAENGVLGMERAKEVHPDLILLDVRMPGLNGPETLLKIREDETLKTVPVMFLTSLGDPMPEGQELDEKFAMEFGANGYIHKTDNLDKIVESVRKILGR
jgi:DNA-binding response OmpR family regulator